MNNRVTGMKCIRCGTELPIGDYVYGCPHCREMNQNSSVTFTYAGVPQIDSKQNGMKRYRSFLPYDEFVTLGEGGTPTTTMERLADELELEAVLTKNEFQNPSGSHKDRMNPMVVQRAIETGRGTIACASSGNEGISLALYAAKAGLRCVSVVANNVSPIWGTSIFVSADTVVTTPTTADRIKYLEAQIQDHGWYCVTNQLDPSIGSSCFGIQGYKTIAYEIYEELGGDLPQYVFVPTCRGDLLYGVYEGFCDLVQYGFTTTVPHLVAVEPKPRLERVLGGEDWRTHFSGDTSVTPSIGGVISTIQSVVALRGSGGFAVSTGQEQSVRDVVEMARHGFYLETSSAIVLSCLRKLISENIIHKNSKVLLILTSCGYKNDPGFFHGLESEKGTVWVPDKEQA